MANDIDHRETALKMGLAPGKVIPAHKMLAYVIAVVHKERQRLARRLGDIEGMPAGATDAILDTSEDDQIFRWISPADALDEDGGPGA